MIDGDDWGESAPSGPPESALTMRAYGAYSIVNGYIELRYSDSPAGGERPTWIGGILVAETPTDEREASIEGRLPLTPAVFHILLALAEGERHGYAIMREVAEQTNGQMRLGPGTLYGSIRRMLEDGIIEESEERPDPALDDERRRYYRLTGFGRRLAEAEATRLQALTRAAQARGLLPNAAGAGGLR